MRGERTLDSKLGITPEEFATALSRTPRTPRCRRARLSTLERELLELAGEEPTAELSSQQELLPAAASPVLHYNAESSGLEASEHSSENVTHTATAKRPPRNQTKRTKSQELDTARNSKKRRRVLPACGSLQLSYDLLRTEPLFEYPRAEHTPQELGIDPISASQEAAVTSMGGNSNRKTFPVTILGQKIRDALKVPPANKSGIQPVHRELGSGLDFLDGALLEAMQKPDLKTLPLNIIGDGPSGVIGQSLPRVQPDVRIRRGQPSELGGFWGRPLFRKDAVSKLHLRRGERRVSSHRPPITASPDGNDGCLDLTPGLFGASSAVRMQHASQAHPVIEPEPSPMKTKILWDVNVSGEIQPPALSDDIRGTLEHIATVEEIETASETESNSGDRTRRAGILQLAPSRVPPRFDGAFAPPPRPTIIPVRRPAKLSTLPDQSRESHRHPVTPRKQNGTGMGIYGKSNMPEGSGFGAGVALDQVSSSGGLAHPVRKSLRSDQIISRQKTTLPSGLSRSQISASFPLDLTVGGPEKPTPIPSDGYEVDPANFNSYFNSAVARLDYPGELAKKRRPLKPLRRSTTAEVTVIRKPTMVITKFKPGSEVLSEEDEPWGASTEISKRKRKRTATAEARMKKKTSETDKLDLRRSPQSCSINIDDIAHFEDVRDAW